MPPEGFHQLALEDQIEYVQSLWSVISAQEEKVAVPTWHSEVLASRLAAGTSEAENEVPWETFRDQLLAEDPSLER
jgi:hypothetical protein